MLIADLPQSALLGSLSVTKVASPLLSGDNATQVNLLSQLRRLAAKVYVTKTGLSMLRKGFRGLPSNGGRDFFFFPPLFVVFWTKVEITRKQ